jgi:hypothetical protein
LHTKSFNLKDPNEIDHHNIQIKRANNATVTAVAVSIHYGTCALQVSIIIRAFYHGDFIHNKQKKRKKQEKKR